MPCNHMERVRIGNKIRAIRKAQGIDRKEIAAVLGADVSYVTKIERGSANFTIDKLLKISERLQVPAFSFFTDETLIRKSDSEKEAVIVENFPDQQTHEIFKRLKSRDDFVPIRILGTASLGQGRIIESEEIKGFALIYKDALPKGAGSKKFQDRPRVVCLYAEGDSMFPTIQDKSLVAVDIDDRDEIKRYKIYAVDIPNSGVTLKRVIKSEDHLMLFADNQNEPGYPMCISMRGLGYNPVCGRVVWAWNKF